MDTLIFATNNENKVREIRHALNNQFHIISLKEAGILVDIPEPHDTLEDNAREKSLVIHQLTGKDCFSEDTGLEVEALDGSPGVLSARYAGPEQNASKNMEKLLSALEGITNRKARFRTVISLIYHGKEYQFEGICPGVILDKKQGEQGFGYDPLFIPDGAGKSFADMSMEEKNTYSHRKKATAKLAEFLMTRHGKN
ncbi:MAG TPA: RdgB/HAM1 family non-canonical purine NTP pyrophosphatase [Ferruginibacter sp.]|nr:RdgB/HAM1 family non-canonical purine NTP pyrophosphatase [Ferruginibacter sp.]